MKINTKKLTMVSIALIAAGAVLMAIGYLLGGRAGVEFSGNGVNSPYRSREPYIMKKTKIDSFSNADIKIGSCADIRILPSGDDHFYLEYKLDGDYGEPFCEVRNDTLTLTHTDRPKQYGAIMYFFHFGPAEGVKNANVNLYIPEKEEMGRLDVYNDSGDFSIEDLAFGDTKLEISYGSAELRSMSFQELRLDMESGDFKAEDVTAEDLLLKNEYGNVTLKQTAVKNAELELESGALKANDFTCSTLAAAIDYGNAALDDISVETAEFMMESGNLDLDAAKLTDLTCKNDYGNVKIRLPRDLSEYSLNVRSEYGSIDLPADAPGYQVSADDGEVYKSEGTAKGKITIKVESGDIDIR